MLVKKAFLRSQRSHHQQLGEFERVRTIGPLGGEFSYRDISERLLEYIHCA